MKDNYAKWLRYEQVISWFFEPFFCYKLYRMHWAMTATLRSRLCYLLNNFVPFKRITDSSTILIPPFLQGQILIFQINWLLSVPPQTGPGQEKANQYPGAEKPGRG